jgi:hypothetical protein
MRWARARAPSLTSGCSSSSLRRTDVLAAVRWDSGWVDILDSMPPTTKFLVGGGAVVAAAIASGVTIAVAQGGDDSKAPITGDALAYASQAALAHTGGGTVTETEVGDEDSYYEVEVTLEDGSQVDVQLDERFNVIGGETDGPADDDGPGDD